MQEVKSVLTPTEFENWLAYIEWHDSRRTVDHYYLAQIAAECRRAVARNPSKPKREDFLLIVQDNKSVSKEDQARKSKEAWGAAVNMQLN